MKQAQNTQANALVIKKAPLTVITNEMNLQLGITLTTRTTRKYLHDLDWKSCIACKKPFLNEKKQRNEKSGGIGPLVEIKGNMNSDSYVNVLANHFVPWANSLLEKYPDKIELIFQQDLAPIHTSAYSEWWMKLYSFDILEWEHLDSMLRKRRPAPETREEL
ncbi:15822_t:CDS:2, partial [Gigaspora margarita]